MLLFSRLAKKKVVEDEFNELKKRIEEFNKKEFLYALPTDKDLTEEQKKEIDEFWGKYSFAFKPSYEAFKTYTNRTGVFDPRYIPFAFRPMFAKGLINDANYRVPWQNKAYIQNVYLNVKQPALIIRKVQGNYYDEKFLQITEDEAVKLCLDRLAAGKEIVVKPSAKKGGAGVEFFATAEFDQLKKVFNDKGLLFVVQEAIKQHPVMEKLNESTVNTVRLTTFYWKKKVIPLQALIKVGSPNVRVDNYKHGGCVLGMNMDGTSYPYAMNLDREHIKTLPSGVDLGNGIVIPGFDKVLEAAKLAHIQVPKIRLISWDIAIDNEGDAVIIEANFGGDVRMHQSVSGPLFREYTEEVLDKYLLKEYYRHRVSYHYDYREYYDHVEIDKYYGTQKKIKIPEKLCDKPVTTINKSAFRGNVAVTKVVLPASVKSIKKSAFRGCKNLESINLENVDSFGAKVFDGCNKKIRDKVKI